LYEIPSPFFYIDQNSKELTYLKKKKVIDFATNKNQKSGKMLVDLNNE